MKNVFRQQTDMYSKYMYECIYKSQLYMQSRSFVEKW